jgi:hypothetical protein
MRPTAPRMAKTPAALREREGRPAEAEAVVTLVESVPLTTVSGRMVASGGGSYERKELSQPPTLDQGEPAKGWEGKTRTGEVSTAEPSKVSLDLAHETRSVRGVSGRGRDVGEHLQLDVDGLGAGSAEGLGEVGSVVTRGGEELGEGSLAGDDLL